MRIYVIKHRRRVVFLNECENYYNSYYFYDYYVFYVFTF